MQYSLHRVAALDAITHLRGSVLLSRVACCSCLGGCLAAPGAGALLRRPRREEPHRDHGRVLAQTLWRNRDVASLPGEKYTHFQTGSLPRYGDDQP